jgi:hypothetical protein
MKIAHTIVSTVAVLAVGVGGYHAVKELQTKPAPAKHVVAPAPKPATPVATPKPATTTPVPPAATKSPVAPASPTPAATAPAKAVK